MKKIVAIIIGFIIILTIICSFVWTQKPRYTFEMETIEGDAQLLDTNYRITMEDGAQRWDITGKNDQLTYETTYLEKMIQPDLLEKNTEHIPGYINIFPVLASDMALTDLELQERQEYPYRVTEEGNADNAPFERYKYHTFDIAMMTKTAKGYAAIQTGLRIEEDETNSIQFFRNLQNDMLYFQYNDYITGGNHASVWTHTSVELHDTTFIAEYSLKANLQGEKTIYRVDEQYPSDHKVLPNWQDVLHATQVHAIYTFDETYDICDMIGYNDALYTIVEQEDQYYLYILLENGEVLEKTQLPGQYDYRTMMVIDGALCIKQSEGQKTTFTIFDQQGFQLMVEIEEEMLQEQFEWVNDTLTILYVQKTTQNDRSLFIISATKDGGLYRGQLRGDFEDDQQAYEFKKQVQIDSREYAQCLYRRITGFSFEER